MAMNEIYKSFIVQFVCFAVHNRDLLCLLEPNYELLLYIGSGKLMLVAFLLSLVLFTVLIVDFTFCHREKGFLYTLCSCKNVNVDDNCERCTHRHLNEITV